MLKSQVLMNACFGVLALGAFVAVDFLSRKTAAGTDYGITSYVSEVAGRIGVVSTAPAEPRLADMFPAAPAGWSVRTFEREDLALVTGKPADPQKKSSVGWASIGTAATDIGEDRTYTRGARTVLFHIGMLTTASRNPLAAGTAGQMPDAEAARPDSEAPLFATVDGVAFRVVNSKAYGVARRIEGRLGDRIDIDIVTTEDDDTIAEILAGLNVSGLNQMLDEPIAGIGTGGVVRMAAVEADAAGELAAGEPSPEGGVAPASMTSALVGLFSGWTGGAAGAAQPVPEAKPEPVEITCSNDRGFKRCRIGG